MKSIRRTKYAPLLIPLTVTFSSNVSSNVITVEKYWWKKNKNYTKTIMTTLSTDIYNTYSTPTLNNPPSIPPKMIFVLEILANMYRN